MVLALPAPAALLLVTSPAAGPTRQEKALSA